jgi:hypothetical protein
LNFLSMFLLFYFIFFFSFCQELRQNGLFKLKSFIF